jgi:hypothetical protein
MMPLAFGDNVFKNKFTSLKQIYDLVGPSNTDRISLKWDNEEAKQLIFRDVEHTPNRVRISKTKALEYAKHQYHFIRLGRTGGFAKRLKIYDLRRTSGKRLNGKGAPLPNRLAVGGLLIMY